MSGPQRRFDPAELRVSGEPDPSDAELADALAAARELEALSTDAGIRPTDGFADRVMAAIATERAPRLVVKPAATVRGGRVGAFLVAVRDSWGVATTGGRPMAVRMQALAFVLLVILAAGAMTGVTALTVGALIGPHGPTTPDQSSNPIAPTAPVVSPTSLEPSDAAEPSESPEPSETAEPSEPGETPESAETAEPGKTPKPTETPRATRTPRPTETPKPGQTPKPTETPEGTDDHGGSDDGGGGSGHG